LDTLRDNAAKAGDIGSSQFEVRKGLYYALVVEIVINAQVLFVIDPVIDLDGELGSSRRLGRNSRDQIAAVGRLRNKLQQINCGGIHAGEWDLAVWEDACVGG